MYFVHDKAPLSVIIHLQHTVVKDGGAMSGTLQSIVRDNAELANKLWLSWLAECSMTDD